MEVKVTIMGSTLRRLLRRLTEEWCEGQPKKGAWLFEPSDRETIYRARRLVEQYYSPDVDEFPPYEMVVVQGMAKHKVEDFSHLLPVILADKTVEADKTRPWDAVVRCPTCGNPYVDPTFEGRYEIRSLPRKMAWFSLDGDLKLFARTPFMEEYISLGLTGLHFTPKGDGVFHVGVKQHVWADQSGVCDHCGIKTNVVSTGCFNLEEDYRYDFQYLRVNPAEKPHKALFVVTPHGMTLLRKYSTAAGETEYCFAGIVPGMMKDLIWPQDKLFTNGAVPVTVLRGGEKGP